MTSSFTKSPLVEKQWLHFHSKSKRVIDFPQTSQKIREVLSSPPFQNKNATSPNNKKKRSTLFAKDLKVQNDHDKNTQKAKNIKSKNKMDSSVLGNCVIRSHKQFLSQTENLEEQTKSSLIKIQHNMQVKFNPCSSNNIIFYQFHENNPASDINSLNLIRFKDNHLTLSYEISKKSTPCHKRLEYKYPGNSGEQLASFDLDSSIFSSCFWSKSSKSLESLCNEIN